MDPYSRNEGHRKLEFGRKEAHDTVGPVTPLRAQKVKVTRPLNVVTENLPCLRSGMAYNLKTWYTDGV